MPKKSKDKLEELEEDIIIGYNSKRQKDNPPSNKNKVKRKSKKKKQNKSKKKKKKRKSNIRKILKILLKMVIVVTIATCIILFLFVSPVFNIQEIKIVGAKEISESIYIAMSGIEIGENIFGIDKTNIQSSIKEEAYVETVQIKSIYPNKVEIHVTERYVSYLAESNGKYFYLDKNGYILETSFSPLDLPIIKGYTTDLENAEIGSRIDETDFEKFNDLIKIIDAVQNNDIDTKLTSIDVSDVNNYILEFTDENKKIMLGDSSDLSAKMAWINLFIKEKKNDKGTIYLNADKVYFSPSE